MKNLIKKTGLGLLVLPLFFSFTPAVNQQNTVLSYEPCDIENNAFDAGEEIVYKIYYNWNFVWIAAGEVTFKVYDRGDVFHIAARGRTYSSYEWFFKVRDNYDSYVDKENLLPRVSIRDVHEGTYERYDKVTFNQNANTAISLRGKTKDDAKSEAFNVDGCMHDVLSIVYYMRNLDFNSMTKGDEVPVKIFMDRETFPLTVKYKGTQNNTKVKGAGRFRTHKFTPQLIAGDVFKEGDEMNVYISNDKNKIPLLIESPVSVGAVKVVLKSYKGLKYDFTAKN